jgi:transketolase
MGAVLNGMAVYGGIIPYGGTFLIFSDYARPAIRIAALSHVAPIFVFTHDSVGLGEDGPTHQPIEHLAALRAMPNLLVLRPADANETAQAWKVAIGRRTGPTLLALTRQAIPVFNRKVTAPATGLGRGAYVLADFGNKRAEIILMASGSEVSLIYDAALKLHDSGVSVRVVSFPSWSLFEQQSAAYKRSVLPEDVTVRLAVEAGVAQGWDRYVGAKGKTISIERFGASAPYKTIFKELGFTPEKVVRQAKALLDGAHKRRSPARRSSHRVASKSRKGRK